MLAYARLKPGPGFRPLRAFFYYLQRLVTIPWARVLIGRLIGTVINRRHSSDFIAALTIGDKAILHGLRRHGLSPVHQVLSETEVAVLSSHLAAQQVVGPDGMTCRLDEIPAGTGQVAYSLAAILECDAVLSLANDPRILAIARNYLGCVPTISSLGIRWSLQQAQKSGSTQMFHRDTDDWRSLKLLVYLTDVDEGSGPHRYVHRSHRTLGRLRAKPYTQKEVENRFGSDAIRCVIGARGTAMLIDAYGIHCGVPPIDSARLILQIQYSILPIYAFLYEPQNVSSSYRYNSYVNRLIMQPVGRDSRINTSPAPLQA